MDKFDSREYKRSRNSYVVQCTAEYMVALLVGDVFLAKLLSSIGISDSLVGIISSFVTLAFAFQILTLFIETSAVSAKKQVLIFDTLSVCFFMFLYFIPFLPLSKIFKTALLIISILIAYISKYFITNIFYKWANSYVSPDKRARYAANKEMISLFSGMIFTPVVGYVIDKFESCDNLSGGFLFLAISIFILNVCNFISILLIKKDIVTEEKRERIPLSIILKETVGKKSFRGVIVLTILWDMGRYFTIGFLGVFKNNDLLLSVLLVQTINIASNFARLLVSKPIGKYSDRKSFAKGYELGLIFAAVAFFANIFTTKSTWFFIIIYTVFYNCSLAGTYANSFNMVYSYVDSKYIVHAMAIKNCIGGILGFVASIIGGKILDAVQANNNTVFGIHIYGQQLLSGISFLFILIAIAYVRKIVEKQDRYIQ